MVRKNQSVGTWMRMSVLVQGPLNFGKAKGLEPPGTRRRSTLADRPDASEATCSRGNLGCRQLGVSEPKNPVRFPCNFLRLGVLFGSLGTRGELRLSGRFRRLPRMTRLSSAEGSEGSTWPGQLYVWVENLQETWQKCRRGGTFTI